MVAAPTDKSNTEVAAVKEVEKAQPSAQDLKKSAASDSKPAEEVKAMESEASNSKDLSAEDISSKLAKAVEKLSAGKKALLQNQPQPAVDHLAEACALQSSVKGDMCHSMCEYYFYYGRALLDLARIEGDVLGNALSGVPDGEDLENSQVENPEKMTEKEGEEAAEGEAGSEDADEEEEGEEVAEDEAMADDQEASQEDSQEDEEDISSLQLAWEVLELAKTIYMKKEEKSDDDVLKLSQVYLKLGEVCLENENYPESINMYSECLKLQESVLPADDRWLAETHYQLGLAHSLADNFDEAVQQLQAAISVIEARIGSVKGKLEENKIKIADDMDMAALSQEQKGWVSDVKELEKLLPELQDKVTDIKDTKASFTEKLKAMKAHFSGQLSGGSSGKSAFEDGASTSSASVFEQEEGAESSKDAKPISTSLIRKKRKPDEPQSSEAAKKPRIEESVSVKASEDKPKSEESADKEAPVKSDDKKKDSSTIKPEEKKKEESEEKMDVQESEDKKSES